MDRRTARATHLDAKPYHFRMLVLGRWNSLPEPYRTILIVVVLLIVVGGVIWQNRTPRPSNRNRK